MKRPEMKAEIEKVAREYVQEEKEKGRTLDEIGLIYYLSGYFSNEKLYLGDVLEVARTLDHEGLIGRIYI